VHPVENSGGYFPFVITLHRSRVQEPIFVELAANDEKTRKQCIAVIKVASSLTLSVRN
jgi:hypothetical protein